MPYQGSKSAVADNIIEFLPCGKRFVDLFGGGAAMSHCAVLSGKYDSVYYNELNPLLCDLLKRAIDGEFNYSRFKPEFISREEFHERKDVDGYVRYVWSFGNKGDGYLFGSDIEPLKHSMHNFVVFGIKDNFIKSNFDDIDKFIVDKDIHDRRIAVKKYLRLKQKTIRSLIDEQQNEATERLQQLERLQRLQQLEQLQRLQQLEQLEQLEINCGSYLDYEYQDGDVVYCDPPYEGTEGYNQTKFNHKEFYDWVATRPYQVFFSSYEISDKRFSRIWQKEKQNIMNGGSGQFTVTEYIYTNKTIQHNTENPLSIFQSVLYG